MKHPDMPLPNPGSPAPTNAATSIGQLLLGTGRLQPQDIARIEARQREANLPFGEAAMALGLLSREDLDFALSRQFNYNYLPTLDASIAPQVVTAYKPFGPVGEQFRALRSQLLLRWSKADGLANTLAIVSPQRGDGRSFVAANLAVVFAQQGQSTLLLDANLRHPQVDQWIKAANPAGTKSPGLAAALAGRTAGQVWQAVPQLPGLSVLPAGAQPPNPQELLAGPAFQALLQQARACFDVILIDTPASAEVADAEVVASRAGAALLVARQNATAVKHCVSLTQRLQDAGVHMAGCLVNGA